MEVLYNIFILPIELLLRFVLITSKEATGNWGLSLVFLSISFNLLLLPFYVLAENVQNREREIKKRMEKKILEFNEVFRGKEKFLYVKTLYRQNGYHPIYALRGLLPLAIQVPVFIAAYALLNNFPQVEGVAFYAISDLSKPDGLLFGINLLPIIMTVVNLAAGAVYTTKMIKSEKIQVLAVSLIFLVLLYDSPSALVLYWTFNNLFSLVKNLAYLKFNFRLFAPKEEVKKA